MPLTTSVGRRQLSHSAFNRKPFRMNGLGRAGCAPHAQAEAVKAEYVRDIIAADPGMITLAILAGGRSQRMGQDKALMPFRGEVLVSHVLERLAGWADEVLVIAPDSQKFHSLGIQCIPDRVPGRGPLGGLYTALMAATNPAIAAVACDMPFASADLLAYQRDILIAENVDVVVPSSKRGLEPLHAVYRRETCLPPISDALEAGEQRLISWFSRVKVRVLRPDEIYPFDPLELFPTNINTIDEFLRAEKIAEENPAFAAQGGHDSQG